MKRKMNMRGYQLLNSKAFTLIELLAVIVILAIIALIAVPIILNIINDSKISANERSAELYIDAVEQAVARRNLKEKFIPTECTITNGSVACDGYSEALIVEVNGESPLSGTIKFDNGEVVSGTVLNFSNFTATLNENKKIVIEDATETTTPLPTICKAVDSTNATYRTDDSTQTLGNIPSGNYTPGDEYICEVKDGTEYHFYVLSTDRNNVNLIMDSNIASSAWVTEEDYKAAGVEYCDSSLNSYCNTEPLDEGSAANEQGYYYWYYPTSNRGPISAMNTLHNATKDWNNIPNIIVNYIESSRGWYNGISTSGNITTITDKSGGVTATYENLKAKLPETSELENAGCVKESYNNCPLWLTNNMDNSNTVGGTSISGVGGYWTSSSYESGSSWWAYSVTYNAFYYDNGQVTYSSFGARPVISIPKAQIK